MWLINMNQRHAQRLFGIFFAIHATLGENSYRAFGRADVGIRGDTA